MHKSSRPEYFEAIIQLRPATEELVEFIEKRIENDGKIHVAKRELTKTGADYYVSSNKFARKVGKEFKRKFKGELKESVKLYSQDRQSSKVLYRVTVCLRLREVL